MFTSEQAIKIDRLIDAKNAVYGPGDAVVFRHPLICDQNPDKSHESYFFGTVVRDVGDPTILVAYLALEEGCPQRHALPIFREFVKPCFADWIFDMSDSLY